MTPTFIEALAYYHDLYGWFHPIKTVVRATEMSRPDDLILAMLLIPGWLLAMAILLLTA